MVFLESAPHGVQGFNTCLRSSEIFFIFEHQKMLQRQNSDPNGSCQLSHRLGTQPPPPPATYVAVVAAPQNPLGLPLRNMESPTFPGLMQGFSPCFYLLGSTTIEWEAECD